MLVVVQMQWLTHLKKRLMLRVTIQVSDESLHYARNAYGLESFESALEEMGKIQRNYERRGEMEKLDDTVI